MKEETLSSVASSKMKYHGPPLAKRELFSAVTERGFRRSSVTGSTLKSDIKLGQEDKLTEMLI